MSYRAKVKQVVKKLPSIVKQYKSLTPTTELPRVTKTYVPQGTTIVANATDRSYLMNYIRTTGKQANQRLYKMERYDMGLYTNPYKLAKHDVGLDPNEQQSVRYQIGKGIEKMSTEELYNEALSINKFMSAPTTLTQLAHVRQMTMKQYTKLVDDPNQITAKNLDAFYNFINNNNGYLLGKMGLDSDTVLRSFMDAISHGVSVKDYQKAFNEYMDKHLDMSYDEFVKSYKDLTTKKARKEFYNNLDEETLADDELYDMAKELIKRI